MWNHKEVSSYVCFDMWPSEGSVGTLSGVEQMDSLQLKGTEDPL